MTLTYGFYDSIGGDRTYNADEMSKLFEGIITEGIFQTVGGAFVVSANGGLNINVAAGRAWFLNTWTNSDAVIPLVVSASDPTLNRIDTVVLEVDKTTGVRANSIKLVNGTAASVPVAPTLINTTTKKQYALADISVSAGATVISGGNITNKVGTVGTPFITGIVDTIDVATLLAKFEANFDIWYNNLVNQLSGSQVTNLQAQIDALVAGWIASGETWTYSGADAPSFTFTISGDKTSKYRVGQRIKLTQTTIKYFIVTKVAYSSPNTTITVFGGTDYTLANAAITSPFYGHGRDLVGFPLDRTKWQYVYTDGSMRQQLTPAPGTWYNPGGINMYMPIGEWKMHWVGSLQFTEAVTGTASYITFAATLSTGNNTAGINDHVARYVVTTPNTLTSAIFRQVFNIFATVSYTTKTQMFFNIQTSNSGIDSIEFPNNFSNFKVILESAYL